MEDEEDKQEVAASLANATEASMDAAAVFSELEDIFALRGEQKNASRLFN